MALDSSQSSGGLFPEEHSSMLKTWIVKRLEKSSDAEPDVLADYVLALLRHPGRPEDVRKLCEKEIPDFLKENDTAGFVNDVFEAIRYQSYRPGAPPPPKQSSTKTLKRGVRSYGDDDEVPMQAPVTPAPATRHSGSSRKRTYQDLDNPNPQRGGTQQRGGRAVKQQRRRGSFGGRQKTNETPGGPNGDAQREEPDATFAQPQNPPVPTPQFGAPNGSTGGMPLGNIFAASQLELQPGHPGVGPAWSANGVPPRRKQRCRDFDTKGYCSRGINCNFEHGDAPPPAQPYSPMPAFHTMPFQFDPRFPQPMPSFGEEYNPNNPAMMLSEMTQNLLNLQALLNANANQIATQAAGRQTKALPNRRKKAPFSADGPVTDRSKSTIVVEAIPEENFDEGQVRGFFGQFGNIVSVSMQPYKRLAVVKYDSWNAANRAYSSPKVVFNNRFVKIYWYKDDDSQLPSSQPFSGNARNGHAVKTEDDEMNMAEPVDPEELARQQEEAFRINEEKQKKLQEIKSQREENQQRQQEILFEQLEVKSKLFAKIAGKPGRGDSESGTPGPDSGGGDESTTSEWAPETLRAQLAELESQARELGIDPDDTSTIADDSFSWAPRRGRGRGRYRSRGSSRGRGYAPRFRGSYRPGSNNAVYAAYSLDNRSKTVVVSGADFTAPDKDELLRHYLFGIGEFTGIQTTTDSAEITFKDRRTADQFFSSLQTSGLPGIDSKLEISWAGDGSRTSVSTPTPVSFFQSGEGGENASGGDAKQRRITAGDKGEGADEHEEGELDEDGHETDDDKDIEIVLDRPQERQLDYDVAEDY